MGLVHKLFNGTVSATEVIERPNIMDTMTLTFYTTDFKWLKFIFLYRNGCQWVPELC